MKAFAAAAAERTLDDTAAAAVTGQTVVDSAMVSVTRAVDTPSGRLVGMAELAGQFVTVGAQLTTVCIDVVKTVSVVRASPVLAVGDGRRDCPVTAAAEMMLEEMDSAAVTGQMVVVRAMVSVRRMVDTCSGAELARFVREAGLAGQFVMLGAQLRTVWVDVARTIRVVSCSSLPEDAGVSVSSGSGVEAIGPVVVTLPLNPSCEGVGTRICPAAGDAERREALITVVALPVLFKKTSDDGM